MSLSICTNFPMADELFCTDRSMHKPDFSASSFRKLLISLIVYSKFGKMFYSGQIVNNFMHILLSLGLGGLM